MQAEYASLEENGAPLAAQAPIGHDSSSTKPDKSCPDCAAAAARFHPPTPISWRRFLLNTLSQSVAVSDVDQEDNYVNRLAVNRSHEHYRQRGGGGGDTLLAGE